MQTWLLQPAGARGSPGQPLLQCQPSLLGVLGLLLHPLEPVGDPVHVGVHSWGGRAQSLGGAGTPKGESRAPGACGNPQAQAAPGAAGAAAGTGAQGRAGSLQEQTFSSQACSQNHLGWVSVCLSPGSHSLSQPLPRLPSSVEQAQACPRSPCTFSSSLSFS